MTATPTSFHHADPGTPESAWVGSHRLDVVLTDGERSDPVADGRARTALGRCRRRKVEGAVAELAPAARISHLRLPNGALDQPEQTIAERVPQRTGPDTIVGTSWLADRRPDHDAFGRACAAQEGRA